jgi:hypothetical protein
MATTANFPGKDKRRHEPRNESKYPLASFCNRVAADSIARYRLPMISTSSIGPPLFSLILTSLRPHNPDHSSSRHALHPTKTPRQHPTSSRVSPTSESERQPKRTRLHHHLRRGTIDIFLEACGKSIVSLSISSGKSRPAPADRGRKEKTYQPTT